MRPLSKQELRGKVLAGLRGYDRISTERLTGSFWKQGTVVMVHFLRKKNSGSSCFTPYEDLMYWRNICGMIQ